jgi:hypothetical protein
MACTGDTFKAAASAAVCTPCVSGSTANIGKTGCLCPAGFGAWTTANAVCAACTGDTFKAVASALACAPCVGGSTANIGKTGCECAIGFTGT